MQHAAVLVGRPHCECIFSLFGGVFNVKHLETLWTKSTTPDFMLKFYFYFKSFYIFLALHCGLFLVYPADLKSGHVYIRFV